MIWENDVDDGILHQNFFFQIPNQRFVSIKRVESEIVKNICFELIASVMKSISSWIRRLNPKNQKNKTIGMNIWFEDQVNRKPKDQN